MSDEPKSDAEMRTEFLIAEHERTIRELHGRLADLEMVLVSARVGREWYANQASDLRAERDRLLADSRHHAAIAAQNATLAAEVDGLRAQALPALTEAMLAEAIARENNATGEPTCSDFIEARQIVAQLGRVAIPGKGDKP